MKTKPHSIFPDCNPDIMPLKNAEKASNFKTGGLGKHTGFTLIEILVSLVIGLFLLSGVMQVFIHTRQTNTMQDELSRMQENARFAMESLTRDIRMADYRGCLTATPRSLTLYAPDNVTVLANNGAVNTIVNPNPPIEGAKSAVSSALDAPDNITVKWSLNGCNASSPPFGADGCPTDPLKECPQNRYYNVVQNIVDGKVVGGTLRLANQEIVEGVENMQIEYGIDSDFLADATKTDGVANYFVDASPGNFADINLWAKVVSVRISLLMSTIQDNITTQPLAFTYNNDTHTPEDRRIRRVFTTTIALRNRVP